MLRGVKMNIDFEYEKKFLDEYMESLKYFKPFLFRKMYRTGLLTSIIGKELGIEDTEFYLAGFYANIGLMAVSKFVELPENLTEEQVEQVKRHPVLGYEFLRKKGLENTAKYVYYHHELPDGSGYLGIDNYPVESAYINIADTFEGLISPKPYRPPYTLTEALNITLKLYKNGLKVEREALSTIENILRKFYDDMLQMY